MNLYAVSAVFKDKEQNLCHLASIFFANSKEEAIGKVYLEYKKHGYSSLHINCLVADCDIEAAILAKYEGWDAS